MGKTHGFTIEDIGDRKYDAEYMNDFIDDLCNDLDTYDERASRLADGYQRYHDNETYVGEAADASKKFIYDVQYDELHMKYHNLQRDFLNACISVEEKFRNNVDSSSRARISEEVLLKIKETFKRYQRAIDDYGFQLEGLGKYAVGNYGKRWGISMIPNYRRVMVAYEEFCGDGGFLDKCILKLREFDKDADSYLKGTGIKDELYELQKAIRNLAVILDSAKVDQPDVEKTTINLLSMNSVNAKAMAMSMPIAVPVNEVIELTPEMIEDLKAIGQEVLLAKDYAMETIDQFMLELPQIMAEMDGGLPIGDLIGMGILLADAIIIVALMAEYLAENNISFSKAKGKGKDKGKEKDKNKTKKPEKPHRKNKDGEPLGKNGPVIPSQKILKRGKTERIEVENPNPGDGNGNVHYHDSQNTKYIFDPVTGIFYFDKEPFSEAPPVIQRILEDPEIQRAIDKALRYLGEPPFFK